MVLRTARGAVCSGMLTVGALRAEAQSIPGAVLAMREPHHHLAFEDSTLRVLRVRVPAGDTTLLHEHDPDYFWIALGASSVINARPGAPDATITSADLSVHYTPGHFAHVARNPGTVPFDNITVELLGAQTNVRNLCEPAVAGKPLDCAAPTSTFGGAKEHRAFASDQLRVSVVTIPPGETMRRPPSATAGKAWIIALDTADAGSALVSQGRGRWVGGVYTAGVADWAIRNHGPRASRVILVVSNRSAR